MSEAADLRLAGVERGEAIRFSVDGEVIAAYSGESVAAAMIAAGRRWLRSMPAGGAPRGLYCGMGACYECVVLVNGLATRACLQPVLAGLDVRTRR